MKKFLMFIATTLISISVFAQENNNRDVNGKIVRGPYLTNNGFFDNTFIGVGGGVNTFYYNTMTFENFKPGNFKPGYVVDGFIGKWFTPTVAGRIGYKGITNVVDGNNFWQHYAHADFMWNISNVIGGYKETRFWDFVPYATVGIIMVKPQNGKGLNNEYGAGIGLYNDLRLSNRVSLYLDVNAVITKAAQFNVTEHRFGIIPSASIGVVVNLGKTNFVRNSTVLENYVPVEDYEEDTKRLINVVYEKTRMFKALQNENDKLRNTLDSLKSQTPKEVFRDVVLSNVTVYFDKGKYTISDRELARLDFYAQNTDKNINIKVTGSADWGTGSSKRNFYLAEQRALAVKTVLVEKYGFNPEKIVIEIVPDVFDKPVWCRVAIVE